MAPLRILVVGIGDGGTNAVARMIQAGMRDVDFEAINTDAQALARSQVPRGVRIGDSLTRGFGTGGDPSLGRNAAEVSAHELHEIVHGAAMVILVAGLGGGTGTGVVPVIARIARDAGALTVAVVTRPFGFEGVRRARTGEEGVLELRDQIHTLIAVQNDRLFEVIDRKMTTSETFKELDDVLRQGIQGISELITKPGFIKLDFADIKRILSESRAALIATGNGTGNTRAVHAARMAISSPFLESGLVGAKYVLLNLTGDMDLTRAEINEAVGLVSQATSPQTVTTFGAPLDPHLADEVRITLIAARGQPL